MIAITLDIDWAPDFMIDFAAEKLLSADVQATWFVTHASSAVDRLRQHPEHFELGIHPNFYPGSSHGETPEEILDHCMDMVPDAVSMRSHGLMQSARILETVMTRTPIQVDTSVFLPGAAHAAPFHFHGETGGRLTRVPYVWEDDFEMRCPQPTWTPGPVAGGAGPRVFDFHPVHVYLNHPDNGAYRELLARCGGKLPVAKADDARDLSRTGPGPGAMFNELLDLAASGGRMLKDLASST